MSENEKFTKQMIISSFILLVIFACVIIFCSYAENAMLFYPTHENSEKLAQGSNFEKWLINNKYSGWKKVVNKNNQTWLFIHGNAGQAIHRLYAENCFAKTDNIFILEYPGYGERNGTPSMNSFNNAAFEAYNYLRNNFDESKICIIGESIGTGLACYLATQNISPRKIVLITPFDKLTDVAKEKIPFLPVSWLMKNKWDNIKSLKSFKGKIEIYGAEYDQIIPVNHAIRLAESNNNAKFYLIKCGHNDWSYFVKFYK